MYIPNRAKEALKELGSQIRIARKHRMWTIAEMAQKIGVSAPTIIALEKGEGTLSVGVLVAALWILGLEKELLSISHPKDEEGIKLMNSRLPKKIKVRRKKLLNDF